MVHSADFRVERQLLQGTAFARTYFANANFTTHLAVGPGQSYVCAFIGYLFDLDDLRKQVLSESQGAASVATSADVFAYMYSRRGTSFLAETSGSYVFAFWDIYSATLTLGTDRYGAIPLFYRRSGRQITFASEIKALLNLESDPEANLTAISEILTLGSPQGEHTTYPHIFRLPSATVITFHGDETRKERYWWYDQVRPDINLTVPEFVDETIRLLGRSVRRLMVQVDRPVCFLSAGYDSRRILVEMARHGKPIKAYTAPTVQHDSEFTRDVPVAKALCEQLGVAHFSSQLSPASESGELARRTYTLLDFEADTHSWILPLLQEIPIGEGINFDGLGGDVLYEFNWTHEEEAAHMHDASWLAQAVLAKFPDLWSAYFKIGPPKPGVAERFEWLFRDIPNIADRYTAFYFTNWTRRRTALFAYGLLSLKVESVFPFLDYDLVDFVFKLAPVIRRSSEVSRAMLRQLHPELMQAIPTSHDTPVDLADDFAPVAYRDRLPRNYWLDSQAAMYRAAAADILRADGVFSQISSRAQAATLAVRTIGTMGYTPHWLANRAWTLRPLGLYALQRRTALDTEAGRLCLDDARRLVYGK